MAEARAARGHVREVAQQASPPIALPSLAKLQQMFLDQAARSAASGRPAGALRSAAPSALALLGEETHEVDALWERAQAVSRGGYRLTVARATVAPGVLARPADLLELAHPDRRGEGLRISAEEGLAPAALLLGLRKGDLITAVNGYSVLHPESALHAYASLAQSPPRSAIVELVRGGQRVVLRIDLAS
jgi:hypothetical protein